MMMAQKIYKIDSNRRRSSSISGQTAFIICRRYHGQLAQSTGFYESIHLPFRAEELSYALRARVNVSVYVPTRSHSNHTHTFAAQFNRIHFQSVKNTRTTVTMPITTQKISNVNDKHASGNGKKGKKRKTKHR